MRPKLTLLLVLAGVLGGTLLLDRLLYDWAIFQPRNKSGWDAFRWYNFEYHTRLLNGKRRNSQNEIGHQAGRLGGALEGARGQSPRPFVLFLGSSVARYAYNRTALKQELERRTPAGRAPDFNILTHASLVPLDAYYYSKRIRSLRPDLVVYIINPADLDLERYTPPWEAGPVYSERAAENYMLIRRPLSMYYPGAFAREHGGRLGLKKTLRLYLRSAFASIRFKDDWYAPLTFNLRWSGKPLRRYLNYQGGPRPYGVWRDGVSGACFSLGRNETSHTPGRIPLQFRREVMKGGNFQLELFTFKGPSNGAPFAERTAGTKPIMCAPPPGAVRAGVHRPQRTGWRFLPWDWTRGNPQHDRLFVRLSHVEQDDGTRIAVTKNTPVHAGRGVRLPGNLGRTQPPAQDYLLRRRTLQDEELRFLNDGENAVRFQNRIHPADWRKPHHIALHQLNRLRLAKYYVNWYDFSETFQIRELGKFARRLRKESPGTRLLIINNAENPLTLDAYENSAWYAGYLRHMQKMARELPGVNFLDLHAAGRAQDFSDAHHLTYDGARRMTPAYVDGILDSLELRPKKAPAK